MITRQLHFGAPLLAFLGLLSGCGSSDGFGPALRPIPNAELPIAAQVIPTRSSGALEVAVRVVNAWQVPVSAAGLQVTATPADGSEPLALTLEPGATGVARTQIAETLPGSYQIEITESTDGVDLTDAKGEAWTFAFDLPQIQMAPFGLTGELEGLIPSHAAPAFGGMVFAAGDKVWWRPADPGASPYVIADMELEVGGLQAAHIDNDGVLDLLVWGGADLILLRGLPDGGYTWSGGYMADFGAIVGVVAADVNSDRDMDLAVGISGESQGQVEILYGSGSWSFDPATPLIIGGEFYDLTAVDEGADGTPDVGVLAVSSGTVKRYTIGENGWQGAPTSELNAYQATPGASLLPSVDLNGDRNPEVIIQGSAEANTQDLVFYILADEEGSPSTSFPLSWGTYTATIADMDGSGTEDLVILDDDTLHVVRWSGTQFLDQAVDSMGPQGPIAANDWTNDGINDLAAVSDIVRFQPGKIDEEGNWTRDRGGWRALATALEGDFLWGDFTNDGLADVVGLTSVDGQLTLSAWTGSVGDDGLPSLSFASRIDLDSGAVAYGLQQCGTEIYALTEGGSGGLLHRARLATNGTLSTPSGPVPAEGTLLACGTLPNAEPGVIVAQSSGDWATYAAGLGARDTGTGDALAAVALADTDGDGAGEIVGCANEGCSVIAVRLGDHDVVVRSDGNLTVESPSGSRTWPGTGTLSSGDLDNDGQPDVLAWDEELGRLSILRAAGIELTPPTGLHSDLELLGRPVPVDIDGDGLLELAFRDSEGKIWHSGPTQAE